MTMNVEIWSDLICPWCGLGHHRLELALAGFAELIGPAAREQVRVLHRSFQLDPNYTGKPESARQMLARKYGMNDAQLDAAFRRVESLAEGDGLSPYVVGDNWVGNTRLAHELLAFASEQGVEDVAWKHLYRAYFGEKRSIFELDALVELGAEIGLDAEEARAALLDERFRARVEADGRQAQELGATGVPFVVVDRRYAIGGAQPVEVFREALVRAWRERRPASGSDVS